MKSTTVQTNFDNTVKATPKQNELFEAFNPVNEVLPLHNWSMVQTMHCIGLMDEKLINCAFEIAKPELAEASLEWLDQRYDPLDVIEFRAGLDSKSGAVPESYCGRLGAPKERAKLKAFIERHNGKQSVYFGVNPRSDNLKNTATSGKNQDVKCRRKAFIDLDFKSLALPPHDPEWQMALSELKSIGADIVKSGNGYHAYFDLTPSSAGDADSHALATALQRLGSDPVGDLARISRIPYTMNVPTQDGRSKHGKVLKFCQPIAQSGTANSPQLTVSDLSSKLTAIADKLNLPGCGNSLNLKQSIPGNQSTFTGKKRLAPPSFDVFKMAVEELPNDDISHGEYTEWISSSAAIKGSAQLGGFEHEAEPIYMDWCAKWPKHDPAYSANKWATGLSSPRNAWGTLKRKLQLLNPAGYQRVQAAEAAHAFQALSAQTHAAIVQSTFVSVKSINPNQIEPRKWLYGSTYIAGYLSMTIAPGGHGKSTLMLVEAVAIASGLQLLSGDKPVQAMKVWYHNAEDDRDELERRLAAVLKHFKLTNADLKGNLYMTSGRDLTLNLASADGNTFNITPGIEDALVQRLLDNDIKVLILDPLGAMHSLPENSNEAANTLLLTMRNIAHKAQVSLMLVHHASKAASMDMSGAGAAASRGASAWTDGARMVRQLVRMSKEDARKLGVSEDNRSRYVRIENGKANLAPAQNACWICMQNVPLNNGHSLWPNGDYVGVVERWEPPSFKLKVSTQADLIAVQNAIIASTDIQRSSASSPQWVGHLIAQTLDVDIGEPTAKAKDRTAEQSANFRGVKELIGGWLLDGALVEYEGRSQGKNHAKVMCIQSGTPAITMAENEA